MTSWWLNQPIWTIWSSNRIIFPSRGEIKKPFETTTLVHITWQHIPIFVPQIQLIRLTHQVWWAICTICCWSSRENMISCQPLDWHSIRVWKAWKELKEARKKQKNFSKLHVRLPISAAVQLQSHQPGGKFWRQVKQWNDPFCWVWCATPGVIQNTLTCGGVSHSLGPSNIEHRMKTYLPSALLGILGHWLRIQ